MWDAISKIPELLKVSGWPAAMLAIAAGLFLYLSEKGVLPPLDPPWVELVTWGVVFIGAALAAASLASAVQRWILHGWAMYRRRRARLAIRQAFIDNIPFLTKEEKRIFAYLLTNKQKNFTAEHDGGYASTLLGKGYIEYTITSGQSFDMLNTPMTVNDYVWAVLQERPEDFPYEPMRSLDDPLVEVEPWRIPWQLR